ncbi:hypothetical protein SO802_028934 [Lithocarpus litseifolius]|uniref:Uncharacterized protein n=1 Tax=Lithocarpus litseifolius TaxID=425828 RepID=A0AAW2BXB9_9ROSI
MYDTIEKHERHPVLNDKLTEIVDPKLSSVGGEDGKAQQIGSFLKLASACSQKKSEARPDMIDVAKELMRIEKSLVRKASLIAPGGALSLTSNDKQHIYLKAQPGQHSGSQQIAEVRDISVHLILDFVPLSKAFQDASQAIRASNPRLACIDVSKPRFLARRDLPPVELPIQCVPQEAATPREETASTHLSLEAEIDQFCFEEEGEWPKKSVELSDSEADFDRTSSAPSSKLIVARIDSSSEEEKEEEEEEGMDLKQMSSLKDLLANRSKGESSKGVPKIQVPTNLPTPSPLPPIELGLKVIPDLRKKRPADGLEEGEVVPKKRDKQQKKFKHPRDNRAKSVESWEETEVRRGPRATSSSPPRHGGP